MNPGDYDHPDLTAHVLGELDAEHSEAMVRWMESHPEASAEAGHIADLAQMLAESAPVTFQTLLPHQRAAVLSGPQRVRQLVAAARQAQPRGGRSLSVIQALGRLAAAAVMLITGYIAGAYLRKPAPAVVVVIPAAKPAGDHKAEVSKTPPFRAKEVPPPVVAEASRVEVPKSAEPVVSPAPEPKSVLKVATAAKVDLPPAAPQPQVVVAQSHNHVLSLAFVSTFKGGLTQVSLRPSETRPLGPKPEKGLVNAAPMTATNKVASLPAPRVVKQPELLIHSWKAEVASCPWDESHRLVRLVVQMPGEQPAASSASNSYPLQMNFSPNTVRSYRPLGERIVPASKADSPAFHIIWYEVVPNGPAVEGATRTLGDIMLPNARFTTQAMAPFDSSKLHVLDRGISWRSAQEDFLFESAVVAFGLLLKGEKDTGGLNHSLVLDLAERSKQADRTGEHAKFVKLVQEARQVAGLK